jgi:hypothetical protein
MDPGLESLNGIDCWDWEGIWMQAEENVTRLVIGCCDEYEL